ncbi:hypothetical protein B0T26DRAFT_643646 [Lasiosphaeria miniovina]|uniref:Uncharacterized protein n=1 Tax=Lasiosphaeria miniovina TaxID=1954250 RepID=A0AA40AVT0_9PEZI|nr:uncharacterized protein B0T26DRAFT_643646 [Lasiosphaeria miniovina]KAK0722858.1 hypothetical protein B0T26DRAFT_643646 [Lasiosphaeria miniovina]
MEKGHSHTSGSDFESDSQHDHHHLPQANKTSAMRTVDTARIATTALALLMGATVLGVSANTLAVYDATHVPYDFFLPLWPDEFNIRPTVALVVGSTIVILANIAALCFSKVRVLRNRTTAHTSLTFAAPLVGLAAALIAIAFFYAVNADATVDTFLSWTCRWQALPMDQSPRWADLCRQSHAGLYLAILLIPVEAAALGLAAYQFRAERGQVQNSREGRKGGSPVLS